MKTNTKSYARKIRHYKIRKMIVGTNAKPRLAVFRSNRHFYAQIIDDINHHTITSFSSLNLKLQRQNVNIKIAQQIGFELANLLISKKIISIVFDRAGFLYHGQIAAFANALRQKGIKF